MNKQKPTTVITAEQAAVAYWKAGELEDEAIDRFREKHLAKIKYTVRCGFFWRKKRRMTGEEVEKRIEHEMEDVDYVTQFMRNTATAYYEISRSMEILPGDQEVTVPVSIAQLAFATKED